MTLVKSVLVLASLGVLAACANPASTSSSSSGTCAASFNVQPKVAMPIGFSSTPPEQFQSVHALGNPSPAANQVTVTIGSDGGSCGFLNGPCFYVNGPLIAVTVCNPGATKCVNIDHILVDTGSVGLRVFPGATGSAVTGGATNISALALAQSSSSPYNNLYECVNYGGMTSTVGSIKLATVKLNSETATNIPIQIIDGTNQSQMSGCYTPLTDPNTDASSGATFNGILGVGLWKEDCGGPCDPHAAGAAAIGMYYTCPGGSCTGAAVPIANQVTNVVSKFATDNQGVSLQFNSVPTGGAASVQGFLTFGVGTSSNNSINSGSINAWTGATIAATQYSADGFGNFTTVFNGKTFGAASYGPSASTPTSEAFLDSGSNGIFFPDTSLTTCTGFYCPSSSVALSATLQDANGSPSTNFNFTIADITTAANNGDTAFSTLGGCSHTSFDWGLPFFLYYPAVYVGFATEGAFGVITAAPYWAF